MSDQTTSDDAHPTRNPGSLTTRRGFIAAASLGAVSLYGLWAVYGAAPFRLLGGDDHEAGHDAAAETAGHGGHGAARGPTVEEFRRDTEAFIARHRQTDGSVRVDPDAVAPPGSPASDHGGHDSHGAGHDMPAVPARPPEIHLLVQRWSFEPEILRLRVDVPYRLRMMAVDVAHGASLQLGRGSRIIRLRQGVLVEQDITFQRPGEYLLYCTLYCGIGHDRMAGRIIVT
jgi:hypothetical protein